MTRPRVLVIAGWLPGETSSAGDQRLVRVCRLLAEAADVEMVGLRPTSGDVAHAAGLRSAGIGVATGVGRRQVLAALARRRYDVVVVEFWYVAEAVVDAVRRWQPSASLIIDSVDLEFVREERRRRLGSDPDEETAAAGRRRRELAAYGAADGLVFVSAEERDRCLALLPAPPAAWVLPILVEPRARPDRRRAPIVTFVANYWHAPNVDGITWFVRDVWPSVHAAVPAAELHLVGANVWSQVTALGREPAVRVVGHVPDLGPVYDESSVVIAPLRYGAGVKGKVCEALASAAPLVTTAIGGEGLDLRDGVDAVVVDDAAGTAAAVVALLEDPRAADALGAAGQASVLATCAVPAQRPVVASILASGPAGSEGPSAGWWVRPAVDELAGLARSAVVRGAAALRRWLAGAGALSPPSRAPGTGPDRGSRR